MQNRSVGGSPLLVTMVWIIPLYMLHEAEYLGTITHKQTIQWPWAFPGKTKIKTEAEARKDSGKRQITEIREHLIQTLSFIDGGMRPRGVSVLARHTVYSSQYETPRSLVLLAKRELNGYETDRPAKAGDRAGVLTVVLLSFGKSAYEVLRLSRVSPGLSRARGLSRSLQGPCGSGSEGSRETESHATRPERKIKVSSLLPSNSEKVTINSE